jgi:hypothetical protein
MHRLGECVRVHRYAVSKQLSQTGKGTFELVAEYLRGIQWDRTAQVVSGTYTLRYPNGCLKDTQGPAGNG